MASASRRADLCSDGESSKFAGVVRAFDPLARALLRAGVSPDAVTVAGTVGVLVGAVGLAPRGASSPPSWS